jgi:hypothetical protein
MPDAMTDEEIVELARIQLALGQLPNDEALTRRLEEGLNRLTITEGALLALAAKLLDGKQPR